jgi:hypothetical protein
MRSAVPGTWTMTCWAAASTEKSGHPDQALGSNHPDFDRRSVDHVRENGSHPHFDKVNMFKWRACFIEYCLKDNETGWSSEKNRCKSSCDMAARTRFVEMIRFDGGKCVPS